MLGPSECPLFGWANDSDSAEDVTAAARNPVIVFPYTEQNGKRVLNENFGTWRRGCWNASSSDDSVSTDCVDDSVNIPLGTNNYFVQLNGTRGLFRSGDFRISIQPAPPPGVEPTLPSDGRNQRYYEYPDTIFQARALDPAVNYSMTVALGLANRGNVPTQQGQRRPLPIILSSLTLWKE